MERPNLPGQRWLLIRSNGTGRMGRHIMSCGGLLHDQGEARVSHPDLDPACRDDADGSKLVIKQKTWLKTYIEMGGG